MSENTDRRTIRSNTMIKRAFVELLKVKHIDNITVSELTEKADISRGTFYKHFKNLNDIFEEIQNNLCEQFDDVIDDYNFNDAVINPKPFLIAFLKMMYDNAEFYQILQLSAPNNKFRKEWEEHAKQKLLDIIPFERFNNENQAFYCIYYLVSGTYRVVRNWIRFGMQESVEEMADILSPFIKENLKYFQG